MKFPTRPLFWLIFAIILGIAVESHKAVIRERNSAEVTSILGLLQQDGWPIDIWQAERTDFNSFATVSLLPRSQKDRAVFYVNEELLRQLQRSSELFRPGTNEKIGRISSIGRNRAQDHGFWEITVELTSFDLFEDRKFYPAWTKTRQSESQFVVPVEAVQFIDDGSYLWLYRDGEIEKRKIELGQSNPWVTEVRAGLSGGENVIVNGMVDIEKRSKVTVRKTVETPELFKRVSQL